MRDAGLQSRNVAAVRAAMKRNIVFCREDDDCRSVLQAMEKRGLEMMPVVDANQRFVGILRRNDCIRQDPGQ
jgi:Mg/Co/Ni transporter MgtE